MNANFEAVFAVLDGAGGGESVADRAELVDAVGRLLGDPGARARRQDAARRFAAAEATAPIRLAESLAGLAGT
jgi:hypothetical protein